MCMLALAVLPQMQQSLNAQKVLSMIIIHDLAEAITADIPVWQGVADKTAKLAAEKRAITTILSTLDDELQQHLLHIWEEYETRESPEARFVKALDTLDVIAQHNAAPIESWDTNDYLWQLSPLQNDFFDIDPFLREIKDELDTWSIEKAERAHNSSLLDQNELRKRKRKA